MLFLLSIQPHDLRRLYFCSAGMPPLPWMAEAGFSGTPGLLFKDTSGQWRGQTGVPSQEALGRMLGVTE